MGARPSSFRKGGGRLNNVDVTIIGYEFTDDILTFVEGGGQNREPFKPGKYKNAQGQMKERFHSLTCLLSLRVDGADQDIVEPMFVGGADDWAISDDGQEIWDAQYEDPDTAEAAAIEDPKSEKQLGQGTAFFVFLESLAKAGFPDTALPEHRCTFGPIVGTRVRVVQVEDPRKKGQKRVDKKTKKEYPYNLTAVDSVLALPEGDDAAEATPAPAKTAGKAAGKGKATAPVVGKKAAAKAPKGDDLDTLTKATLFDIVREQGEATDEGTVVLQASKLSMAVLKKLGSSHPQREDVRKRIYTILPDLGDDGVVYDKAAGTVSVPAED